MMSENRDLVEKLYNFQVDKVISDIDVTVKSLT